MLTTCSVTNKLHLIADYCIFCDGESEIFYNSIVELKLEHDMTSPVLIPRCGAASILMHGPGICIV